MSKKTAMTIGELGRACGVGIETIRYYQRLKLLDTPSKSYGTIRRYGDDALERVQFIKRAQRLGFSLAEIKILYMLDPKRDHHRAHVLARSKLAELDQKLADMIAMRSALAGLVSACESGEANVKCPIVVAFANSELGSSTANAKNR